MPSEKTRSKEDTWTTKELESALKKEERKRSTRDKDDRDKKRDRHRDEVNGEEKHRRRRDEDEAHGERRRRHHDDHEDEGRRRRHHDDDDHGRTRKHHDDDRRSKPRDEDGRDRRDRDRDRHRRRDHDDPEVELTEEDRERLRRERREKREGKKVDSDDKEKRRGHREEDGERDKHRRHKDEDDERTRRHRTDEDDKDKKSKDRPRHDKRDEEEEERERQRRERREKKEREVNKDRDREKPRDEDEKRKRRTEDKKDKDTRDRDRDDRHLKGGRYDEKKKSRSRDVDDRKKPSISSTLSDKSRLKKREPVQAKSKSHKPVVEEKEEEDEYNYEDDFEDYEEDFEEDVDDEPPRQTGDSEMDEVLRALDAENDRLVNQSRSSDRSNSTDQSNDQDRGRAPSPVYQPKYNRAHTVIDFVSAKQRALDQKTSNKTRQRGSDLLAMIELDVAHFDLFDLPPVKEYDLYIRSFGRSDTRQAYVQTNDDNIDRDIQTEEIDTRQKWTQHPPENFTGCGRGDGEKDEEDELQAFQQSKHQQQDLGRLNHFLQKAGQTIAILLEEEKEDGRGGQKDKTSSHLSISESYTQLGSLAFLEGRHVQFAHFSPTQPNLVLTIYSKPEEVNPADPVGDKGIICVWNTNESFYPQKILACQSQPTCCCFSPVKTSLAFAGMVDGSVAVWDLREPSSLHRSVTVQDKDHTLRFPTYNTAGVLDHENHHSSVRTITPIISYANSEKSKSSTADVGSGLSFQLISLEENAVLSFWVVAEIHSPDAAGSETDLGLAPGGRIKLIKSSSLSLENPDREVSDNSGLRALELQLLSMDPNHYYVGTDSGSVLHGLRFGSRAYPSCHSSVIKSLVEITCIDFSPFNHPCFLAGCGNGEVRLHHTKTEHPVVTWPVCSEGGIVCVCWSRSRPCVFYVLDETSTLHVYDILEGDAIPLKTERIKNRVVTMTFTTDHHAMGVGIPGKLPQMLLSLENGQTEIHTVTKQLREQQTLEQEFLESYLDRF